MLFVKTGRATRLSALTLAVLFIGAFLLVGLIVPDVAEANAARIRREARERQAQAARERREERQQRREERRERIDRALHTLGGRITAEIIKPRDPVKMDDNEDCRSLGVNCTS